MLMTLVVGGPDDPTLDRLNVWARALAVEDHTPKTLRHDAHGHTHRLWWDVARRFIGGVRLQKDLRKQGWLDLAVFVRDVRRKGIDEAMRARYLPLAELPRGTLGRPRC